MKKKYFTKEERRIVRNEQSKKWYGEHKEEKKEYRKNNKEKMDEYHLQYCNNRRKIDINFKLACYSRSRITKAIIKNYKVGSAVKDLGCSIPELKLRLESMFQPGMTWDNWSQTGWHIDHIIPLSSFNLSNREEFLKAVHFTNLQPLWAEENLNKMTKINGNF